MSPHRHLKGLQRKARPRPPCSTASGQGRWPQTLQPGHFLGRTQDKLTEEGNNSPARSPLNRREILTQVFYFPSWSGPPTAEGLRTLQLLLLPAGVYPTDPSLWGSWRFSFLLSSVRGRSADAHGTTQVSEEAKGACWGHWGTRSGRDWTPCSPMVARGHSAVSAFRVLKETNQNGTCDILN